MMLLLEFQAATGLARQNAPREIYNLSVRGETNKRRRDALRERMHIQKQLLKIFQIKIPQWKTFNAHLEVGSFR